MDLDRVLTQLEGTFGVHPGTSLSRILVSPSIASKAGLKFSRDQIKGNLLSVWTLRIEQEEFFGMTPSDTLNRALLFAAREEWRRIHRFLKQRPGTGHERDALLKQLAEVTQKGIELAKALGEEKPVKPGQQTLGFA